MLHQSGSTAFTVTAEPEFPRWHLVDSDEKLLSALHSLTRGTGSLAVDTERASGYRYGNSAYLIQLYRTGCDVFLIDPIAVSDLSQILEVFGETEWILHAATQDLPCLREINLNPSVVFDTELAARLLGFERVGLGSVVENLLGITLEKAHSAADWSTRPLPTPWLEYAALDVALLPQLRTRLHDELVAQDKLSFALQEFAALERWQPKPAEPEPWRKLSGLHAVKHPKNLAIARELWIARDALAQERDTAPGRLLPDASIIAVALTPPRSASHLSSMKEFRGRASRSELPRWWDAIYRAKTAENLPDRSRRSADEMPPHRVWAQRFPEADARLKATRSALSQAAEEWNIPIENILTPATLRSIAWKPPSQPDVAGISALMAELGAREWQISITAQLIADAIASSDIGRNLDDGKP